MGCGVILTICNTQDALTQDPPHQTPSKSRPATQAVITPSSLMVNCPIEVQPVSSKQLLKESIPTVLIMIKKADSSLKVEKQMEPLPEIHLSMGSKRAIEVSITSLPQEQIKQSTPKQKNQRRSSHSSRKLIPNLDLKQEKSAEKISERPNSRRQQVRVGQINDKILTPSYLLNINPSREKLTEAEDVPSVNTLIKSIEIKELSSSNLTKMKRQSTKRLKQLISQEQPQQSKAEDKMGKENKDIYVKTEDKKVAEKKQADKKTEVTSRQLKSGNSSKNNIINNLKSKRQLVPVDSLFLQSDVLNKPNSPSNDLDPYRQEIKLGSKENQRPALEKKMSLQAKKMLEEQRKEEKKRREADEKKLMKVYNVSK